MLNPERNQLLDLLGLNKNIVKAQGAWLTSTCGSVYLDFTSQYGAVPFGFNPEFLKQRLIREVERDAAIMVQPFFSQGAKELADLLIDITPKGLKYVTFACTGAEVVEAAIKLAKSETSIKKNRVVTIQLPDHPECLQTDDHMSYLDRWRTYN